MIASRRSTVDGELPALQVAAGRALVMVTTHDCGMDKVFNAVVDTLVDPAGRGLDEVAGKPVGQGLLMAGRVVGYLPVPALVVNDTTLIPAAVVDLDYRTTLDRARRQPTHQLHQLRRP